MKFPINKKMMMLPGIGIFVFGISVMGMLFMKGSKVPVNEQTTNSASQEEKEDDTPMTQIATSTTGIAKPIKEKRGVRNAHRCVLQREERKGNNKGTFRIQAKCKYLI